MNLIIEENGKESDDLLLQNVPRVPKKFRGLASFVVSSANKRSSSGTDFLNFEWCFLFWIIFVNFILDFWFNWRGRM